MPPRNNILLRRFAQSRRVSLPNSRTFLARYDRVNRVSLYPTNFRIKRTYTRKIGPRRQRTKKTAAARGKWVYRLTKHNKRNRPWKKSSKHRNRSWKKSSKN